MKPLHRPVLATLALLAVALPARAAGVITFTDQASFLAATGATSASGPLPDLGLVTSAAVGTVTFSLAPGGDNMAIGAVGTQAEPDWTATLPGNDIAMGWENLQVDLLAPVYSLGFDFEQPDATMPSWGGTPVDSVFEVTLWDGATLVGQVQFSSIASDVATFLGVWSSAPFSTATIIDVSDSPFVDDDEFFGEFYTGDVAAPLATLVPYTDRATFLLDTGAISASGPLPNLGTVGSAKLGSVNVGIAPGGDDISIGPFNTGAEPDWCPLIPGNDIAQGWENLLVEMDAPVTSFGLDFVQPDATMPSYGGTPVDSTFELRLYAADALVGAVQFSAIPVDVLTFLGVASDVPFDSATLVDVTDSPFVDDDEFYGEMFTGPGPHAWNNLGYNLLGTYGDPLLFGTGPLTPGSDGHLVLVSTVPSQLALLFLSLVETPVPFKGGTLATVPVLTTLPVFTNSLGEIDLAWPAWPSGLSGLGLHFQYGMADAASVKGVALSNALRADVP